MQTGACQPGADGEFAVPEDPHGRAHTQPFGQGAEDFPDATSGRFEAVQDRAIANAEFPGTARHAVSQPTAGRRAGGDRCGLTGLALEVSDIFLATVADEGVDLVIGDALELFSN